MRCRAMWPRANLPKVTPEIAEARAAGTSQRLAARRAAARPRGDLQMAEAKLTLSRYLVPVASGGRAR